MKKRSLTVVMLLAMCILYLSQTVLASSLFRARLDFPVGKYPLSVAIGDFGEDGTLDLVTANYESDDVSVLLGNGDGTFQTAVDYGAGNFPESVAIGDLDGDGTPDLAVANVDSNNVSVLLNISVRISTVSPMNGQIRVGVNTPITATFSESMDLSTLNIDTFLLNDGTNYIAGTVNCEGSTATFMPTTALSYNTTYTVTITTGAKDSTGNPLQGDYLWSFKTRAETDSGSGIWLQISGEIAYEETPLCSMVLANGQHMFTCGNDLGIYDLEVPLDQNGEITLYGFCAGFSPFKTKLAPAEALDYDIHMTRSPAGSREMEITVQTEPGTTNPDRVRISGTVTYNETLLCAMVLANGQSMFSCGNNLGNFDLEVPLDLNGEITLYCFCSGFAPYKDVFVP